MNRKEGAFKKSPFNRINNRPFLKVFTSLIDSDNSMLRGIHNCYHSDVMQFFKDTLVNYNRIKVDRQLA